MRRPYTLRTALALFARLLYLALRRMWRRIEPVPVSVPPARSDIMEPAQK
jgi:hypothetical protein